MHCSRCGAAINEELNFCSKCGERVRRNEPVDGGKRPKSILETLSAAAIAIGIGGMIFLVGLVAVLLDKAEPPFVLALAAIYIVSWLAIMILLIRQISRVIEADLKDKKTVPEFVPPGQIAGHGTAQLHEPRDFGIGSVTEHTTRTLEKTPVERN